MIRTAEMSIEQINDANMYINASFTKKLTIEPTGLDPEISDYIAIYCANEIYENYFTNDKKEILIKASILSCDLNIQNNMFRYFGIIMKYNNKEKELQEDIHFFIDMFEELINKYKMSNSYMINSIHYLEDAYNKIHRQNRLGNLGASEKENEQVMNKLFDYKLYFLNLKLNKNLQEKSKQQSHKI